MRLIDRVLAPEGIAYISYNTMPAGYLRMALRDMLLHELGPIADDADRTHKAIAILEDFDRARKEDTTEQAAMRHMARANRSITTPSSTAPRSPTIGICVFFTSRFSSGRAARRSGLLTGAYSRR